MLVVNDLTFSFAFGDRETPGSAHDLYFSFDTLTWELEAWTTIAGQSPPQRNDRFASV